MNLSGLLHKLLVGGSFVWIEYMNEGMHLTWMNLRNICLKM